MKPAKIIVLCIAAVAAIGLALVVRAMGNSGQPAQVAQAAAPPVDTRPKTQILVAAKNLDPGQRLTEADMTWKEWPIESLDPTFISDGSNSNPTASAQPARPDGAIATVARAASNIMNTGVKSDYIGAVVREAILQGEPILARKIVLAGDSGYLAAYLEPGTRAMSIRVSVETAAGGFILPGDRVDVLLTRDVGQATGTGAQTGQARFVSTTVMRNVKVLAIDQTTRAEEGAQAVVGATATLQLAPGDAEALALAKSEGELSLVLRSYADTGGPSGRVNQPARAPSNVRVFRGGAPEVVVVQ
jgi:Flp pilus assembly protein CpaB